MKQELIDTFLYNLREKNDFRANEAYEVTKLILIDEAMTYNKLANHFIDTTERIKRLIKYACYVLGLPGESINSIRTAYIKFLEEEVELLCYQHRKEGVS